MGVYSDSYKPENRISKSETNSNFKIPMTKTENLLIQNERFCFGH